MKTIYTLLTFLVYGLTYGQIVNPISATTSLTQAYTTSYVEWSYDGTGLDTYPSLTSDHAGTKPNNSFLVSQTSGAIDFNLGGTFNIDGIAFWNQNAGGPSTDVGVDEVNFFYSTDGVTYTLIPGAPTSFLEVTIAPSPPVTSSFTAVSASYIRMTVISNHGGTRMGFAEIAFDSGGTIINPISATTSLTQAYTTSYVEWSYDGTGLDTYPSVHSDHAGTKPNNSFLVSQTSGAIDFNLGGTFNIDGIAFWNQNAGGPSTDVGVDEVNFFSSTDGVTYTLIPGAPTSFLEVTIAPSPPVTSSFTAVSASHIRMTVISNHGGTRMGFAEIAFASGGVLSNEEFSFKNSIKLFPNPSSNFIQVAGLSKTEKYVIFDAVGKKIKKGSVSENISINIEEFSKGIYFLKLEEGNTIRFIKE